MSPYENDAIWARFYRDGKTLGEICEEFDVGIYDLSPWLTAPLIRSGHPAIALRIGELSNELERLIYIYGMNNADPVKLRDALGEVIEDAAAKLKA